MVELLEAELAAESARAIRDVAARHRGEELSVQAVEALIRAVTRAAEHVLTWGRQGLALFDRGLEGQAARALLTHWLAAFRTCREAVALIGQAVAHAEGRTGHPISSFAHLADLARDLAKVEKSAATLNELAHRPIPPADPALLGQGVAAYERGETEDVQGFIARLRAGRSL